MHAGLLFWNAIRLSPPPAPRVIAGDLRLPEPARHERDDALLKNTLDAGDRPPVATPPVLRPGPANRETARRRVEAAQRKISEHLYYPPEAVARGIQGEVRLLLTLADDGRIVDVSVAASSGHAILDQAALKAAQKMGRVNWAHSRELILPVVFRLE